MRSEDTSIEWKKSQYFSDSTGNETHLLFSGMGRVGAMIVEFRNFEMSAVSALVSLRFRQARYSNVSLIDWMTDVPSHLGVFVRRSFVVSSHPQRLVLSAALCGLDGRDIRLQLFLPYLDLGRDEADMLSELAISKAVEMYETDVGR